MRNYLYSEYWSRNTKIDVGDGFPVPRRKAFYNKQMSLFSSDKPVEIGTFCFCDILVHRKSLRDSGRAPRPLQKIAVILCVANGRI